MRRVALAAAAALAAFALAGCGSDDESSGDGAETTEPTETTEAGGGSAVTGGALSGSVGPGFEISMQQSEVAAGSYTLTVDDQSGSHNFHLTGEGVDVSTDVGDEGTQTFQVELRPGTYTFVCDPHSRSMRGTLTVG
jgi:plastocyanin